MGGPIHALAPQHAAIPLRDAVAPDVAEHRRPVHPERRRQLLREDAPTVGSNQLGHLAWCKASLHRERPNHRVGWVDRRLAWALP